MTAFWFLLGLCACSWWQGESAVVRKRLDDLVGQVNAHSGEGFGAVTRAARIGAFFTDDVVVELGRGTQPISGRDALTGMAARLNAPTAAFRIALADVTVHVAPDASTADATLTAEIHRHSPSTGQPSMDAREFALVLRKENGEWKIARVTAVETLK